MFEVSKGDFPVRAEISDAPIVPFLALTQSALFCLSPVLLDFKKFINSGTFAIAVYIYIKIFICAPQILWHIHRVVFSSIGDPPPKIRGYLRLVTVILGLTEIG